MGRFLCHLKPSQSVLQQIYKFELRSPARVLNSTYYLLYICHQIDYFLSLIFLPVEHDLLHDTAERKILKFQNLPPVIHLHLDVKLQASSDSQV